MRARGSFQTRRLGRIDGVDIWRVDGHRVRDELDVDFTNGHHHYSRPYVPIGEVWLDREAPGAAEWELWALRQTAERAVMARGASYLHALRVAAKLERQERRRLAGARVPAGEARRRPLGEVDGRVVWLVDGRHVRDHAYVDFTLGGHGYRYRFIPRSEIWLDDAVHPAERPAILHHEAVEVGHMAGGMGYDEAHGHASAAERRFRRAEPKRKATRR
jgi:hypothetical protein